MPFIIFAYMYQPNIPPIYRELKNASYNLMLKIVLCGTGLVIIVYLIAATFGYLTWAGSINMPNLLDKKNILQMDY